MFKVVSRKINIARIGHKCIWCGEFIKKREEQMSYKLFDNQDFYHLHFHVPCFECYDAKYKDSGWEFNPYKNKRI